MVDAEGVLLAAFGLDQYFGLALERTRQVVDAGDVQLHAAQRDQHARLRRAAGFARAQAAVHGHRLRAVLAQVDRAQAVAGAQRVAGVAVAARAQADRAFVPVDHLVPQAHCALVRDEGEDLATADHGAFPRAPVGAASAARSSPAASVTRELAAEAAPAGVCAAGCRDTSSASTKLPSTPSVTVLPIARSTGIDDSASRKNTSTVIRLQVINAC